MRRLSALLLVVALVGTGCTGEPETDADEGPGKRPPVTLASLGLDWPPADGSLDLPRRPATPEGFDDATLDRMAKVLARWARVAAVDESVWDDDDPVGAVTDALPAPTAKILRTQLKDEVSPNLGAANVFADDVRVLGTPVATGAWKVSTDEDDDGKTFVLLELQTRTAYEVRSGDGPKRVIGVLRVHGLNAYRDTTTDFGVSGGWQEFGAGDCVLAVDDVLKPDSDVRKAQQDLQTFVEVGNGSKVTMPPLGVEEQVDEEYLKRCREGAV